MLYSEGVSRSGALMLAYMLYRGTFLLEAAKLLKDSRRTALCNLNFMRQLVTYAAELGYLDPSLENIKAPSSIGRPLDRHRVITSYLPNITLTNIWWKGCTAGYSKIESNSEEKAETKSKKKAEKAD